MQENILFIPYAKLITSKYNARTVINPDSQHIKELAKNIESVGILNNLLVHREVIRQTDLYYAVVAGQRRYLALKELFSEGKIDENYPVPVKIISEEDAAAFSIIENVHREPMQLYDQLKAFKRLAEDGQNTDQIAGTFGYSVKHVSGVLQVANVSPSLISLLLDDQEPITLDQLKALSIVDDHERQEAVWNNAEVYWKRQPNCLREALMESKITANDRRVKFIGLEAYEQAGGEVIRDLFCEDMSSIFLTDVALVEQLTTEKLRRHADEIKEKEGWGFADIHFGFVASFECGKKYLTYKAQQRSYTNEEAQRIAEIDKRQDWLLEVLEYTDEDSDMTQEEREKYEEEYDLLEKEKDGIDEALYFYPDDIKENAGILVYVCNNKIEVIKGLMHKCDEQGNVIKMTALHLMDAFSKKEVKEKPVHSESHMRRLTAQRTAAVMASLLSHPDIALRVITFNLASKFITHFNGVDVCELMGVDKRHYLLTEDNALGESKAMMQLDEQYKRWCNEWNEDDYWSNLQSMMSWPQEKVIELLAFCVSISCNGVISDEKRNNPLTKLENLIPDFDIAQWWQPTAKTYFNYLSKNNIAKMVSAVASTEETKALLTMKKAEAALAAEKLVDGKGWMPEPMFTYKPNDIEEERNAA